MTGEASPPVGTGPGFDNSEGSRESPDDDGLILPREISANETLLRSVRKNDINRAKQSVKWSALKATPKGDGKLSLIRQQVGDDLAKNSAVEKIHGADFRGFGRATADTLREHCESIEDDPEPFPGHANLIYGFEMPGPHPGPHEPQQVSDAYGLLQNRLMLLGDAMKIATDPAPTESGWSGVSLAITSAPQRDEGSAS